MALARAAFLLVASAALLAILVRLLEPRLAFFPSTGETTTPRHLGVAYEQLTIETADGERLRGWSLPSPQHPPSPGGESSRASARQARALIIYFHGNGGNLSNWAPILTGIASQGYAVLAFDYRGYGVSSGRPTEKGLYRDVDAILDHVSTKMKPTGPVIYWGRSLGVSMAAYATRRSAELSSPPRGQPAGLILESGFPDARSL